MLLALHAAPGGAWWRGGGTWQTDRRGAFLRDAGGRRVPWPDVHFLPVVYSSFFTSGFAAFSAYLHARGIRHVALATAADVDGYEAASRVAVPVGDAASPLAVLLHPRMREGLSFTHATAIVTLEPLDGLGTETQVRARVLRRYASAADADADRPVKLVYAMRAGWGALSDVRASVEAETGYFAAATREWWSALTHTVPGLTSAKAYKQATVSVDDMALAKVASQRLAVDAIGGALHALDDAAASRACSAAPTCHVCLSGVCGCVAAAGGPPLCAALPLRDVPVGPGR